MCLNFAKSVGHYTCNFPLSDYRANRWIKSRMESLESSGFFVLYGPPGLAFYSNMIEGSLDTFRNRNSRVNLLLLGLHVGLDPFPPGVYGNHNGSDDDNDDDDNPYGHGIGGTGDSSSLGVHEEPDSQGRLHSSYGYGSINTSQLLSFESEQDFFPATESL